MKLIVGLGNPGKEYENTRHNIGFMVIDKYLGNTILKNKDEGEYYIDTNNKIIYLKPLSFMNDSGRVVRKFADYYKIKSEDILIIYDDMDFEVGNFKIKASGSAGGHNGIKNIINTMGTSDIKRIRVGISKPEFDKINYVLGNFSKEEKEVINNVIEKLMEVLKDYIDMDFEKLMNKYN